jgi:xanthine dehydrogenase accessory factor
LLDSLDRREGVALVSITEATGDYASQVGRHAVVWPDEFRKPVSEFELPDALAEEIYEDARMALAEREHKHLSYIPGNATLKAFVEVQVQPPHLIIVGAGHIAVPLASMASLCDFEVTVLDDRPQYAHPARFPTAQRVIAGPFTEELRKLRGPSGKFDNHTYIVLVTRGHQYDVDSLVEVLDDPVAYIGMIGSRRRIRAVYELLERERGIPPEKFDRVHAPIGLNIGARTPAEIAVCIMAEIINQMRGGPAEPMNTEIQRERRERRERAQARRA